MGDVYDTKTSVRSFFPSVFEAVPWLNKAQLIFYSKTALIRLTPADEASSLVILK